MQLVPTFALLVILASPAIAGDLPDPSMTPGLVDSALTKDRICSRDFHTASIRNVPSAVKAQAYEEYHLVPGEAPCPCEIDHLVSLELGGSNDITNLWPQSYVTMPWNAHKKDALENHLHKLVCEDKVTLAQAQREIAVNWISSYVLRVGELSE
jgi:hypothetical protein